MALTEKRRTIVAEVANDMHQIQIQNHPNAQHFTPCNAVGVRAGIGGADHPRTYGGVEDQPVLSVKCPPPVPSGAVRRTIEP
jgi:hypothetical protein